MDDILAQTHQQAVQDLKGRAAATNVHSALDFHVREHQLSRILQQIRRLEDADVGEWDAKVHFGERQGTRGAAGESLWGQRGIYMLCLLYEYCILLRNSLEIALR